MEIYINPVEISITSMIPSSGTVPQNAVDPTSSIAYQAWELNDAASFNFQVPAGYPVGTDFVLKLWEATDTTSGASGLHQWGATVVLVQPDVNIIGAVTETQAFSGQFMAPTVSGRMTVRELTITDSGQISATPIQANDMVAVTLTRIAASSGEDPNSIKVANMTVAIDVPITTSACGGDVGHVIDVVRDLFEGQDSGFMTDAFIIRQINETTQRLAINDTWTKYTWINLYSGSGNYDLNVHIPDFVEPLNCKFSGDTKPLSPWKSHDEYWNYMIVNSDPTGTPSGYLIQGSNMLISPIPDTTITSGVCVYHSYLPADASCISPALPVNTAFLDIYEEFVLHRAYERDSQADEYHAKKSQEHLARFEQRARELTSAGKSIVMGVRPTTK